MKKLAIAVMMLILLCAAAAAEEHACGDYLYALQDDGTAEITGYTGSDTQLAVPAEVDGYAVTAIDRKAFEYMDTVVSVELPESVSVIEEMAFQHCSALSEINIPEGVTEIGYGAFQYCRALASIELPEGLRVIESFTFLGCISLSDIKLPDSVARIDAYAFEGCPITELILPASLERLECAFNYCAQLTRAHIPAGLTYIEYNPFAGCTALTEFTVAEENACYAVMNGALCDVRTGLLICAPCGGGFTEYDIPQGIKLIGESAFNGCGALERVTIPAGITAVGYRAFEGCAALDDVELPEGVEMIGAHAFDGCNSLTRIRIPKSVYAIGDMAFDNCASLEVFEVACGSLAEKWAQERGYECVYVK